MNIIDQLVPTNASGEKIIILSIEDSYADVSLISIEKNKVQVLGRGESQRDEYYDISPFDIAISQAEKASGDAKPVKKVILGIPLSYTDNDKIKSDHLALFKKLSTELDLNLIGFTDFNTAISFLLSKKENSPLSAIIIHVTAGWISLSNFKIGKLQQNINLARSSDLIKDLISGISKLSQDMLPTRIVFFSKDEKPEKITGLLTNYQWNKHNLFIQPPHVETLKDEDIMNALIESTALSYSQGESQETVDLTIEPKKEKLPEKTPALPLEVEKTEAVSVKEPNIYETVKKENVTALDFGFNDKNKTGYNMSASDDNLRFPKFEAVQKPSDEKSQTLDLKKYVPSFIFKSKGIFTILTAISSVLTVIGILMFFYYTYPKTTLKIITYPLVLEKETVLKFTTDKTLIDPENGLFLVSQIEESYTDKDTAPTTGKSKIGEKAKGEITVYNKTKSAKSIKAGTIITNSGLSFVIQNDIQVASASDTGEGLTFGKSNVQVTAQVIGPESNLPAGATFTFKNEPESEISSKNSEKFQGGLSRDITSVSKEDRDNLKKKLVENIRKELIITISQKLPPGEKLIDSLLVETVEEENYSSKLGDEATELTLQLALNLKAFSFDEKSIIEKLKDFNRNAPSAYKEDPKTRSIILGSASFDKSGIINSQAVLSSSYIPDFDGHFIKKSVSGKSFSQAADILKNTANLGGISVVEEKKLPFIKGIFPVNPENIALETVSR